MHRAWNVALDSGSCSVLSPLQTVVKKVSGRAGKWDATGFFLVSDPLNFEATASPTDDSPFIFGVVPARAEPPEGTPADRVIRSFLAAHPGARLLLSDDPELTLLSRDNADCSCGLGGRMRCGESVSVRCEDGLVSFARGARTFLAPAAPPGEYRPFVSLVQVGSAVAVAVSRKRRLSVVARDERLWRERRFTDLKIACGEQCFPVHRAVVCAASPAFERLLEQGGLHEGGLHEARLELQDANPQAVEAMLEHIYTAAVPSSEAVDPAELFALAVRFNLDQLAAEVGTGMIEDLGAETVVLRARVLAQHRFVGGATGEVVSSLWDRLQQALRADAGRELLRHLLVTLLVGSDGGGAAAADGVHALLAAASPVLAAPPPAGGGISLASPLPLAAGEAGTFAAAEGGLRADEFVLRRRGSLSETPASLVQLPAAGEAGAL